MLQEGEILLLSYNEDKQPDGIVTFDQKVVLELVSEHYRLSLDASEDLLRENPATYIGHLDLVWNPGMIIATLDNKGKTIEIQSRSKVQMNKRYFWALSPKCSQEFATQYSSLFKG